MAVNQNGLPHSGDIVNEIKLIGTNIAMNFSALNLVVI